MRTLANPDYMPANVVPTVDVAGLDPLIVIAALLNARPGGHVRATPTAVQNAFESYRRSSTGTVVTIWDQKFLSSLGLKLCLNEDLKTLTIDRYDETHGEGLGSIVIDHVRSSNGDDRWRTHHLIYYARPVSLVSVALVVGGISLFSLLLLLL